MEEKDNLIDEFKKNGIMDLIFELGQLTDEELEALVQANRSGSIGIA